jgi:hypothetical protein
MNTTFKSLAAAAALAAFGPAAQAATTGSAPGTGNGDVIFQLFNPATQQTLTWDLAGVLGTSGGDMTASEFGGNPPGVGPAITTFSLANATLDAFLAGMDVATAQWRVLGASQIAGANIAVASPNYGALLTSSNAPVVGALTASSFTNPVTQITSLATNLGNTEGLNNDAKAVPVSNALANFTVNGTLPLVSVGGANTAKTGLGTIDFYYVHRNPTVGLSQFIAGGVQASYLGFFELAWNGVTASLSFNPVVIPVPAAAWLFGSALVGMVGIARRKAR